MEDKSNVVFFPQKENSKVIPPRTEEEVFEAVNSIKELHIDESMEFLFEGLLQQFGMMGFPIREDEKIHIFLYETIRSVLLSYYGLGHPIHNLIEKTMIDVGDNGFILDTSNIFFKKKKRIKKTEVEA